MTHTIQQARTVLFAVALAFLPSDPPPVPSSFTFDVEQRGPDVEDSQAFRITVRLLAAKRFIAVRHTGEDGETEPWMRGRWVRYQQGRVMLDPQGDDIDQIIGDATGVYASVRKLYVGYLTYGKTPKSRFKLRIDAWACAEDEQPLRVRMKIKGAGSQDG